MAKALSEWTSSLFGAHRLVQFECWIKFLPPVLGAILLWGFSQPSLCECNRWLWLCSTPMSSIHCGRSPMAANPIILRGSGRSASLLCIQCWRRLSSPMCMWSACAMGSSPATAPNLSHDKTDHCVIARHKPQGAAFLCKQHKTD